MTTETKKPAPKKPAPKKSAPKNPAAKKFVHVATNEFASQFYPTASHPAKSLRARIRRNADKFADVLVKTDATPYAIPDTKTARDKFAALINA